MIAGRETVCAQPVRDALFELWLDGRGKIEMFEQFVHQQTDVTAGRKVENGVAATPIVADQRRLVNVACQATEAADAPGKAKVAPEVGGNGFEYRRGGRMPVANEFGIRQIVHPNRRAVFGQRIDLRGHPLSIGNRVG